MHLTTREFWTALHGMVFGAGFLLLFSAAFMGIWNLGSPDLTPEAGARRLRRLILGTGCMTVLLWMAVLLGTYWVYPWYRAKPPANTTGAALVDYPKYWLISNPRTEEWHAFAMEWKEHLAWLAPILATAVTWILTCHGQALIREARLRRVVLFLFAVAFFSAAVAGGLGALINKAAPIR